MTFRAPEYTARNATVPRPVVPALLLLLVVAVDALRAQVPYSLLVDALTDELAHLATAALVLTALTDLRWQVAQRRFAAAVLVASVVIDVDHLLLYAHVPHVDAGGRPFSHSLATVVVLTAVGLAVPKWRPLVLGASTGVALHLLRDLGTGPGVPLWWPLTDASVRMPYALQLGVLSVCVLVAGLRWAGRAHRWRSARNPARGRGPGLTDVSSW